MSIFEKADNDGIVEIPDDENFDDLSIQFKLGKNIRNLSREDLKGIIGFLENNYNVKAYIDSQDPSMPKKISDETAKIIKDRINRCKKFILLATNNAIESKWCNWELGYGDAKKYRDHIALFPMKPRGSYDYQYKGSEYLLIYPYISYYNGTEKYRNGSFITQGYYVNQLSDDGSSTIITPLSTWLNT